MNTAWQFHTSPWVLGFVAAFLLASGWFFYVSLRREGRTARLVVLHSLRLLAAIILAITMLKPERVVTLKSAEQPRVGILWDGSGSMATNDVVVEGAAPKPRQDWVKSQLDSQFWKPLEERYAVSVLPFSALPADAKPADLETAGTDLNTPISGALKQFGDLRALLVLSDGDWNQGESPAQAATVCSRKDIPIFSVAVGAEAALSDLELASILAPSYALLNERVSVLATLQNRMPREVKTNVIIEGPGGIKVQKTVQVPPMGQIQEMLVVQPTAEGEGEWKVSVPVEAEDLFPTNNAKTFRLAVRKETLKVLLVDSLPRWEYRYLRNALLRDPGVALSTVLYHPALGMGEGNGYLSEFPKKREDIQSYDVIFLGDVGMAQNQLSKEQCEHIRGLVEQQASGLVLLPGALGNQRSLADSPLADLFPVEMDYTKGSGAGASVESRLDLTPRGRDHWLTMLASDANANQAVWKGLPGFNWSAPVVKSRPGSEVLAVHEAARNSNGRIPLLVTRNAGSGKVLFMGTDAAWRWRKGVEDTYHYRFWGQVVRWMSHQRHLAQDEGLRFFYSPENPKRGDKMRLQASAFDKIGQPVPGEKVTLSIKSPSGTLEKLQLAPGEEGWGVFTGEYQPKEGGLYEVEVAAAVSGRKLTTKFEVTVPMLEKIGQPARYDVLRELAAITAGKSVPAADLALLLDQIRILPEPKAEERRLQLWCNPWWVTALVTLLTIYWIGRKVAGLS
jgi:hypothetical protein